MNTIRTFIPSESVASFKKFANKTPKNRATKNPKKGITYIAL
jgi:hypothetical protein